MPSLDEVIRIACEVANMAEEDLVRAVMSFMVAAMAMAAKEGLEAGGGQGFERAKRILEQASEELEEGLREAIKEASEGARKLRSLYEEEVAEKLKEELGSTTEEVSEEDLSELAQEALEEIKKEEMITPDELARRLGKPVSDVHNAINELKRAGLVDVSYGPFGEVVKLKQGEGEEQSGGNTGD